MCEIWSTNREVSFLRDVWRHRERSGDHITSLFMIRFCTFISIMAQPNEPSLLDKLLKARYPLTNYLSRQQQFSRALCTPLATNGSTAPAASGNRRILLAIWTQMIFVETAKTTTCPPKARAPPSAAGFNVPDTLDPFASECTRNTLSCQWREKALLVMIFTLSL